MRRILLWTSVICGLVAGTELAAAAPPQQPAAAPQVRTAQQQYKNLQVLKDLPATQITPTMHLIAGELGVGCRYCHVWEEWDKEDRPQKQVARRMMVMMGEINKSAFNGAQVVTCYTCHRGSPRPVNTVVLPVVPALRSSAAEPPPPPPPALPTVDQILNKYIQALGGEQALRKVTSRVITAKRDIPAGPGGLDPLPADVEIYQKAPNLTVNVYRTEKFTISDGFDGTTAWTQTATGAVNNLPDPDQGRVKRSADFYEPLDMKSHYTEMEVRGIETVRSRPAYVVVGFPESDTPERLYFDTRTGLLLRRAVYLRTFAGQSPFETDYDNYADAGGGVKLPFVIRMNPASQRSEIATTSTLRVEKVHNGVSIDDARFTRPQAKPAPPAAPPAR